MTGEIAGKGGCPGLAAIILTDPVNAPWFLPPGTVIPGVAALWAEFGDLATVRIGRKLQELLPLVHAVCPACAEALRSTPAGYLPLYMRIGTPAEAFTWRWPFPEAAEELARVAWVRAKGGHRGR